MSTNNRSTKELEALAINFLKGNITDHRGRKVFDYLNMSEDVMEMDHQWIQWAFPINSKSPHNHECGMLFSDSKRFFKTGSALEEIRFKLMHKYLASIGIDLKNYWDYSVDQHKFFTVIDFKHNHHVKRISRVIKHLNLTGSELIAQKIVDILDSLIKNNPNNFDAYTVALWHRFAYTPFWNWGDE